ncbi:helix-turn-helix domain-containing protein [Paramicrobacterium fandaimingii]|uniref:helix-turn-helix domain-containing protein n=1 Tax=Paramicrobacterium fandaimingii TaxID=2708079 RepID=UPI0014223ADA|nr:AraC family transcriptional regulator [Microbacterium fandaimingii]
MAEITQMTYQRQDTSRVPVEVISFDQLRALNHGQTQRTDFTIVAVISGGHGSVTIDFTDYVLASRCAVWIAPGAVHRWADIAHLTGHLVLFVPTAPVTPATRESAATPNAVAVWPVDPEIWNFVCGALSHLQLETSPETTTQQTELPEILVSAFIARLKPPHTRAPSGNSAFARFRTNVEVHFRQHHDVSHYARALGYSPRTLSRAALKETGRTAKTFINDRLILEAKRLLAHDRYTSARCASELGFMDASNFSLFFLRATGQRPGAWQAHATGSRLGGDVR